MFNVRKMKPDEADALGTVMFDAVHHGASQYTAAQRMAWLPIPPQGASWKTRLGAKDVWVASDLGTPIGFVTLEGAGYIDFAFVASGAQGRGAFGALYRHLERRARAQTLPRLYTHASLMAQPTFAAQGFHVKHHETVERAGQYLDRAEMEKHLT